ncbi:MAG: DNA-processing protein DprA [Acidimicrobiales bacterium]
MTAADTDTAAAACALASLPSMGPARFVAMVRAWGFVGAWDRVRRGALLDVASVATALGRDRTTRVDQWRAASAQLHPDRLLERHLAAGVQVVVWDQPEYPAPLVDDVEPPPVLFVRGDLRSLPERRVGVVGTRRCTRTGRLVAVDLGAELARAGVGVVSGLALGVDGAAHQGALGATEGSHAPVVGVVGTGLDVVYPPRHHGLWQAVIDRGVLVSEVPLGTPALPWRFPARNRIIAALSDIVVVVESHATGGALHTVEEALRRDRAVMAVPGSVRSPASVGSNALLHEGAMPARDAADVLAALGFAVPVVAGPATPATTTAPEVSPTEAAVLDTLGPDPIGLDQVVAATSLPLSEVALALTRLELAGWVERTGAHVQRVRS